MEAGDSLDWALETTSSWVGAEDFNRQYLTSRVVF